mgnify:CR=1 FL=1
MAHIISPIIIIRPLEKKNKITHITYNYCHKGVVTNAG